ncbi:MAG: hypothetical protein ACLQVM_14500 [Terriglobia bacterium]
MSDLRVSHWTGAFGVAAVVLWLSQFPLYMMGSPPSVYDGAAFGQHLLSIKNIAFTRILLDQGVYVAIMVFAAGFRYLIRQARPDHEWAGTLVFGAALVWLAVTLVADGLEGGAVLDALSGKPDASAVRALIEGTLLIYNGSTAFALTGMFLAVAGYATFAAGVLPQWTGWVAYAGAALCVACIPAMYAGAVNNSGFYNAGGWGPAIIANFPPAIWFLIASILMIRKRGAVVSMPVPSG